MRFGSKMAAFYNTTINILSNLNAIQVIPGNDQNTIPTNQGATGSKLYRTS